MTVRWTRLFVGALGASGIALAHWVAYVLAAPDPHARHLLLESTGHRYWLVGAALVVAIIVGTVGVSLSNRLRRAAAKPTTTTMGTALILGILQVSGFVLLEASERIIFAAHHESSLVSEPVFWIGLVVQLFFALAGAFLLKALFHAVQVVRNFLRRPSGHQTKTRSLFPHAPFDAVVPRVAPGIAGFSLRGPPA